jgi:hypothetical protein
MNGLPSRDRVVTCRLNRRDLEAIEALVEAGIRTTRSDAAAWLLGAGIAANAELFERVGAAVAEVRRLREQTRRAVLGAAAADGGA